MADRLDGRVAVITGGASGIGRATAVMLAHEGARVIAADLNLAGAEETARRCGEGGIARELDVSEPESWRAVFDDVLDICGRLDVLVNGAGVGWAGDFANMPMDAWNTMVAVNLTGVMLGCQAGVKAMERAGNGGSIINISSMGGLVGGDDIVGYCATKGGVTLLTKAVALYCARRKSGIRCNSVHPTYVDTEMLDPIAEAYGDRDAMLKAMGALVPLGRVARPDDVAHAILFLASDESAMVSGSPLLVDGAQLAGFPGVHAVE
ncbi:MAG: SDR family oxidoreductase [Alphaproteobacteria bacterium]|nr:MAG: SDR family oxidoreductase [Alphaproteobacteria bacterium]